MGELKVSKNTFIVISKLVCLPSFNLLNFSLTSTLPTTYRHTHSVSGQTHTLLLCTFGSHAYIHTLTRIYVSNALPLSFSPFLDGEHTYIQIGSSNTYCHSANICTIHTHAHMHKNEHCYFVLNFPRSFCFVKNICFNILVMKFLVSALFILFVL